MRSYWWKNSNIYQIWPKSFKDSNGDGIGDIKGIIEKLDYIKYMGFDAIWISPFYKSPMTDNGYDVADYFNVDPIYGKNEDIDLLIKKCNEMEIKIIIDIVFNHTSDEHPWFIESRKSTNNKYSNYYIWRDEPVSKKDSIGPVRKWTYVKERNQYYLHLYDQKQPDLNWENEQVLDECVEILKFWYKKGISGFRFDVIELIGKDFENNIFENGPKLHILIKKIIEKAKFDNTVMTVGECWRVDENIALQYTKEENKELSMIFSFKHFSLIKEKIYPNWSKYIKPKVQDLQEVLVKYTTNIIEKKGWLGTVFENHDLPRSISVFGDEKYWLNSCKTLALLQYSLPGTPFVYQGQEIGTKNFYGTAIKQFEDVDLFRKKSLLVDSEKKLTLEEFLKEINYLGRDNARRPMQWNNKKYFGFSEVKPWIEINQNQELINVELQMDDSNSILNFYKKLNELRKSKYLNNFINASFLLNKTKNCIDFISKTSENSLRFIGNFSQEIVEINIENFKETIISTNEINLINNKIFLKPWESILIEI